MESTSSGKTIIMLVAALLAVLLVSITVLYLLPTGRDSVPVEPLSQDEAGSAAPAGTGFNWQVLERSVYKALDSTLLQRGLLPVKPPVGTGKANPFL